MILMSIASDTTAAEPITWFQAVILGIVQGFSEFLPISSSAHLLIVSKLLGWSDPGAAFTAVSQIGTETAVIIYFWSDIVRILKAWFAQFGDLRAPRTADARIGWYVILGTLPIGILGLVFSQQIETIARNLYLVSFMLIGFGLVIGLADRTARSVREMENLTIRHGLILGFFQAMALIPGVSRSGATISGGLFLGYSRASAARYAFLLAIPAVMASGLYQALEIGNDPAVSWGPTILATIIAFFIGYAVIAWLLRYVSTGSFLPFVIYRVCLGTLVLGLLVTGVIQS